MKKVYESIARFGQEWEGDVCLALGMFDGVHRGHQAVLDLVVQNADHCQGAAAALTFPTHPAAFLRPGKEPSLLMSPSRKAEQLIQSGMSAVILQPFDQELAEVEAVDFLSFLKARIPNLRAVCVGKNFRFGKNRSGDSKSLASYGEEDGLRVSVADSLIFEDITISSSRIREALASAKMQKVRKMLGRNYSVVGKVQQGKALGGKIGFPTLNIPWSPEAQPPLGVYAGRVQELNSGQVLPAVANYGLRPTIEVDAGEPVLEVHCLDSPNSSIWKAEATLSMSLDFFIRSEKKFSGVNKLKDQIRKDCEQAKNYLATSMD
ncbi:MAG: riboflavin biosynthesis protein RibF [Opitutales bacterium]|nr:riboflavin biosynthesis protein RibF [Opitutales bacterium]